MLAALQRLLCGRRVLTGLLVTVLVAGTAWAAWTVPGTGQGVAIASADFHAPTVSRSTIAPAGVTAAGGAVRAGGQFVVYANVLDTGGSGIAWAKVNVSSIKAGATAVALSPCSCTVAGKTYTYSSATLTADAPLAQGTVSYSVWAQDNVGNLGATTPYSAVVDSTAPSVTAAVIATSATTAVGRVAQGGTYVVYASSADAGSPASGLASVTADVSALNPGVTALALPKCTSSCSIGGVTYTYKSAATVAGSPVSEGTKSFSITSTDIAANATTGSYSVIVDDTAPTVTAGAIVTSASSTAGFIKQGGAYVVYANAADTGAMSTVKANVSGITAGQTALALSACTSSCTIGGVTYGYKSSSKTADATIAEGAVSFGVTATDQAANTTTGTFSVTVDNTGGTVTQTTIANSTTNAAGWVRKSGAYYVYANVADSVSGVYTVKADVSTLTSGQTALSLTACTTSCTVGGVTYAYKSASKTAGSTLAAGAVAYTLTIVDKANNSATRTGFSTTADNTAPTMSAAALATVATNVPGFVGKSQPYVIYADVADATSGVWKVTTNANTFTSGQSAAVMTACVSSCSAGGITHGWTSSTLTASSTLSAGTKTFTITITDQAGNAFTSPAQSVLSDSTAPTLAITFPLASYASGWTAGCSTASTDDICGTATDASAGVFQVQVSLRQSAAPSMYFDPGLGTWTSATELLAQTTLALPSWSILEPAARFTNGTGYTIRALVTDKSGNTATTSTTFTYHP